MIKAAEGFGFPDSSAVFLSMISFRKILDCGDRMHGMVS